MKSPIVLITMIITLFPFLCHAMIDEFNISDPDIIILLQKSQKIFNEWEEFLGSTPSDKYLRSLITSPRNTKQTFSMPCIAQKKKLELENNQLKIEQSLIYFEKNSLHDNEALLEKKENTVEINTFVTPPCQGLEIIPLESKQTNQIKTNDEDLNKNNTREKKKKKRKCNNNNRFNQSKSPISEENAIGDQNKKKDQSFNKITLLKKLMQQNSATNKLTLTTNLCRQTAGLAYSSCNLNDKKCGPYLDKKQHLLIGKISNNSLYIFCPCTNNLEVFYEQYSSSPNSIQKLKKDFSCDNKCPYFLSKTSDINNDCIVSDNTQLLLTCSCCSKLFNMKQ
jgi:hypothetical protein